MTSQGNGIAPALTPEQREQFLDQGFVLLRGAIPRDVVQNAVSILEDAPADDAGRAAKAEAIRACVSDRLLAAVNDLHGPGYPVTREQAHPTYIPRVRTNDALHHPSPHVDLIHPTIVPDLWAVGAFVFLSDVRHLGGAFLYSPGSPNRLRAWMSAYSGESAWGVTKSETVAGAVEECLAAAGDVILFQHAMLHSGSENILGDTTRHALRFSFPVAPRLDTGDRPLDSLSIIEKANSPRYLRSRYGEAFRIFGVGADDGDIREGFGPVTAQDILKFNGEIHRFWTTPDAPGAVQHAVSSDFVDWRSLGTLELTPDEVLALHLEHRFNPTLTLVCRAADGSTCSRVYESADLMNWRQIAAAPAWTLSRPHFLQEHGEGPFMSKRAAGSMVYFVADDAPTLVHWRSGGNRYEMSSWRESGVAHQAVGRVTDLWNLPGPAMYQHVLVADIDGSAHYGLSFQQDVYDAPLAPFELAQGQPSQLRAFERAQGYWLVTYKRDGRVHWGAIDWTARPGAIQEFASGEDLQRGLQLVGLS